MGQADAILTSNHGHNLGQDNGHVLQMILFYQCVVKQWYYIGSFMDRPMCAPLNTNEWQNNGFTWAISWANQCEAHLIQIHGETVVIHGQFHGPTMWSPCNANVCQNSGLTWAVSWANQCEPQAIPTSNGSWCMGIKGECPARFVSHLHEICINIYELFIAFVSFVVCSLL